MNRLKIEWHKKLISSQMNRLKIEWHKKLMNRNTEIRKNLEIEMHWKFGMHENRIKRQPIKKKIRELKNTN